MPLQHGARRFSARESGHGARAVRQAPVPQCWDFSCPGAFGRLCPVPDWTLGPRRISLSGSSQKHWKKRKGRNALESLEFLLFVLFYFVNCQLRGGLNSCEASPAWNPFVVSAPSWSAFHIFPRAQSTCAQASGAPASPLTPAQVCLTFPPAGSGPSQPCPCRPGPLSRIKTEHQFSGCNPGLR